MVIKRKASALELTASGFDLERINGATERWKTDKTHELIEVWTPNVVRYLIGDEEVFHEKMGGGPLATRYGFVPYVYQIGIPGGQGEFGPYGLPVLNLVDSNIRMIDALETFRYNAIHMAAFPSYVATDLVRTDDGVTMTAGAGDEMFTVEIKPGMINYSPRKKIEALTHPGLNKDFDKALIDEKNELRRIIPDVLIGIGESSGYNSAQMTNQALRFFYPVIDGEERLYEKVAVMDFCHIEKRVPGPIYMDYAYKASELDSTPGKVARTRIDADDIDGYHGITCSISREVDVITKGSWAAEMVAAGLMPPEFFYEAIGERDPEQRKRQIAVHRFLNRPDVQELRDQQAIKKFGLVKLQQQAAAMQRITPGPDGTPMVAMPDGSVAGPGMANNLPQFQGSAGAQQGGMNMQVMGPNMASTHNPSIGVPTAEQPNGARRRGGAIPGAGQRQGWRKTVGG
jgi:hypothetical protein